MNIIIDKFENIKSLDYDTYIVIYKRNQYQQLKEYFKSTIENKEHQLTVNWDGNFFEIGIFGKLNYRSVKILRNVKCPYIKDGKPRGWFLGENGKPQRYTGVSNSMYFSKSKFDRTFSVPLLKLIKMMFTNSNDNVKSSISDYSLVENPTKDLEDYLNLHFVFEDTN